MRLTVSASVVFPSLVSAMDLWSRQANSPGQFGAVGFFGSGSFDRLPTLEDEMSFIDAGHRPNMTSSVTFNFALGNTSNSESTWTWRVNISDVPLTDDRRVINSQWELQWPGSGSLESLLAQTDVGGSNGEGLCLKVAELTLPSNITSRYSNSDQGNCSTILGSDCVEELRKNTVQCKTPLQWANIEQCMDTLNVRGASKTSYGGYLIDSSFNESIQSGDSVWYHTSGVVPTANISFPYTEAETRLNILVLQEISGVGRGAPGPSILCQVVNPSASSGARSGNVGLSGWVSGSIIAWFLFLS